MIQRSNENIALSGADLNPQQLKRRFRGDSKRPFSGQQVVSGVSSNCTATMAKSITAKEVITINTETFIDGLLPQMGFTYNGNIYYNVHTIQLPNCSKA